MNPEWVAWAKDEIIALSKIVQEKNAEIAILREREKQAEERGARSMLEYVTRHYAVNKVATDDEVFKYWKDARGK